MLLVPRPARGAALLLIVCAAAAHGATVADAKNEQDPGQSPRQDLQNLLQDLQQDLRQNLRQEPGAQEARAQETVMQEARALEAGAQEARAQEAGAQEARALEAGAQEARAQEAGEETRRAPTQDIVVVWRSEAVSLGAEGCRNATSCPEHQHCNMAMGECECMPGYHWTVANARGAVAAQVCAQCPGLHQVCEDDGCCFPDNEASCNRNVCQCRYDSNECSASAADDFKLATQIALVSAIILVIACLLVILWRTCRKQHGMRRRAQRRSDASAASLTSVQLRVIERLRNRPPGYHDRAHIRIEKPPSYEDSLGQPLRYPALVLDPTNTFLGHVETTLDHLASRPDHVESRPDHVESRPDHVESRPDHVESRPGHVESRPGHVESRPDHVESRPDHVGVTTMTRTPGGGVDNCAFVNDELAAKQGPPGEQHM